MAHVSDEELGDSYPVLHRLLETFRKKLRPMEAVPEGVKLFEESLRLYEHCIEQR